MMKDPVSSGRGDAQTGTPFDDVALAAHRATMDGERLISVFAQLVEPLGKSLPANSEVVLHDLSRLPNSIVAVHGSVTGRAAGGPATDMLLKAASAGELRTRTGYETRLKDGRTVKSSTMVIHDVAGHAVAALCINTDLSAWQAVQAIANLMLGEPESPPSELKYTSPAEAGANRGNENPESFFHTIEQLADHLISEAVRETGVPVELMHKKHKIEVIRSLKSRGFFLVRDGVEMIAAALQVTRFTIYNYLNEISDEPGTAASPPS